MSKNGEIFLKEKSGKHVKCAVDNIGRAYTVNAKGDKIYIG